MAQRWFRALTILLIMSFLVQSTPVRAVVSAEPEPAPLEDLPPLPPPPAEEPPLIPGDPSDDRPRPILRLQIAVDPQDWVRVGDLLTTTLTLWNDGDPAEGVVLTLPLPKEVNVATAKDQPARGQPDRLTWDLGTLTGASTIQVSVTLRLIQVPFGDALVLEPTAQAANSTYISDAVGGALVDPVPPKPAPGRTDTTMVAPDQESTPTLISTPEPADPTTPTPPIADILPGDTARFIPGQAVQIPSHHGRVQVAFPADAYDQPLTLAHQTLAEHRPLLAAKQLPEPPAIAGLRRGFGAFFLEAQDDQGRDVTQFKAPVTITMRFTPQQLRVLGIVPEDLAIFWFDEQYTVTSPSGRTSQGMWVPQQTSVNIEQGVATAQVDHFSGFQLAENRAPSEAYLPTVKGWQVDGFTGAASYSLPIDLPAGRGGIKPNLTLTYNSTTTDGNTRANNQASWVGKGWSLDPGFIALNRLNGDTTTNSYALSLNGRTYHLMRTQPITTTLQDPKNLTHWIWRSTDEGFLQIRAEANGSPPTTDTTQRYHWIVWDTSGYRYEFNSTLSVPLVGMS